MVIPQRQATNDSVFDHLRQEYVPKSNMPQAEISSRQSPFLQYSYRWSIWNLVTLSELGLHCRQNVDWLFWILINFLLQCVSLTLLSWTTSIWSTVHPLESVRLGSAPLATSSLTHSSCPRQAANPSGYSPQYVYLVGGELTLWTSIHGHHYNFVLLWNTPINNPYLTGMGVVCEVFVCSKSDLHPWWTSHHRFST